LGGGGEKKFYEQKGFDPPRRCPDCRKKRKASRQSEPQKPQVYEATHEIACKECGKTAKVPFKPRSDKPVYCAQCFEKRQQTNKA